MGLKITQKLQARAQLLANIRDFFAQRKVLEVNTSVLSQAAVTDPAIESFTTHDSLSPSIPPRYLRTSPEFCMKRLLSVGSGDIFEMGPVFRCQEHGRRHNPEFTLLEWYRLKFSMQDLIDEVVVLLLDVGKSLFTKLPQTQLTYAQAFLKNLKIDCNRISLNELQSVVRQSDGTLADELDRDQCLDYLFSLHIQPQFKGLTVITHYPASQAALAKLDPVDDRVALRFEVFVNHLELANGFEELCNAEEQLQRFEDNNRIRQLRQQQPMPIDGHFIDALKTGLPACSGVALGVDRLLMLICGVNDIRELLAWPWEQA